MRRVFYALGIIAVMAFGLICWRQSRNKETRQPHEIDSAIERGVDSIPRAHVSSSAAPIATFHKPEITGTDAGSNTSGHISDKEPLIRQLHVLEGTNPKRAVSLALEDRERFPDSPDAEERDMILVTALHNQGDIGGSKREAWYYYKHYPHGQFTEFLSNLTGIDPPTPSH